MATEYGAFNAEGCFENGMWSLAEAEAVAAAEREAGDDDAYASAMCADHEGEPAAPRCEQCASELADDGSDAEPRYEVHAFARGKYHVYDTETEVDVATVPRKSQAQALVEGLNAGELLVDEQGLIVRASAEAGAR